MSLICCQPPVKASIMGSRWMPAAHGERSARAARKVGSGLRSARARRNYVQPQQVNAVCRHMMRGLPLSFYQSFFAVSQVEERCDGTRRAFDGHAVRENPSAFVYRGDATCKNAVLERQVHRNGALPLKEARNSRQAEVERWPCSGCGREVRQARRAGQLCGAARRQCCRLAMLCLGLRVPAHHAGPAPHCPWEASVIYVRGRYVEAWSASQV